MHIAIIDDLRSDAELLSGYVKDFCSQENYYVPHHTDIFLSGDDFLQHFSQSHYDIIFLDYYMPGLTGLETARSIRRTDREAIIIFTTSSRDFAIDGYKVGASGYLVKPCSYSDLCDTLSLLDFKNLSQQQMLKIICGSQTLCLPLRDILYCDISGHYIQLHTQRFGIKRSRMTFSRLQSLLAPYPEFLLCFRGCLVNMFHICRIEELVFIMDNEERIPFRQKDHKKILQTYSDFLFTKVRAKKS